MAESTKTKADEKPADVKADGVETTVEATEEKGAVRVGETFLRLPDGSVVSTRKASKQ